MNFIFITCAFAYTLEGINYIAKKKWNLALGEFMLVGVLLALVFAPQIL